MYYLKKVSFDCIKFAQVSNMVIDLLFAFNK